MDIVSRQRINLLIQLADLSSDDVLSPEFIFIKRVAKECNFCLLELNKLLKNPEPIGSFGALSPKQKKEYVVSICELMMLVELTRQNQMLCQKVTYDLGYNKLQFDGLKAQIQSNLQLNDSKVYLQQKLVRSNLSA